MEYFAALYGLIKYSEVFHLDKVHYQLKSLI